MIDELRDVQVLHKIGVSVGTDSIKRVNNVSKVEVAENGRLSIYQEGRLKIVFDVDEWVYYEYTD